MVFIVQTAIHLLVLFLFINLITGLTTSGKDAMTNNHIGIAENSRRLHHEEELLPYRSMHNPLRQRIEEERGYLRLRDEYLRSYTQRKDKKAGLENPGYPPSKETVIGRDVEGANAATVTWTIEAVDAPGYFDWLSSRAIAVDAGNHPHIAYGGEHLYYAYHDGTTWYYETVDSLSNVGYHAAIVLDTSGHIYISYFDETNHNLKYATNVSGLWVTTTVDSTGGVGFHSSIALDASGKVHISYHDYTNDDLKYATNASGTWVTTSVDNGGNVGYDTSLKLDTNDKVHISYNDEYNGDLRYATNKLGQWTRFARFHHFAICVLYSSYFNDNPASIFSALIASNVTLLQK